ncbi:MAG: DUF2282 domain-containing protein [Tatlockia sp.]|nr:DUF2282 domain-containing protein [Tatlockia sp.]
MFDKEKLGKSAAAAFFAMMTAEPTFANNESDPPTEKCYGVVKAGLNDCATAKASCAGSATKDNQPDAYLLMPKGLCEKLVGGKLTVVEK